MKVGDYVRTKDGIISKIEDNFNTTMCISTDRGKYHYEYFDIIKSSPNIIDLIEVGDYVNGSYIYSVVEENKNTGQHRVLFTEEDGVLGAGDIKSIVTKEMFANAEYRVETD